MNNLPAAFEFANAAHEGQTRKDGMTPYIAHPLAVCALVLEAGGSLAQAQAALLHDTKEDSGVSDASLREYFGDEVADLVDWVSEQRHILSKDSAWRDRKLHYILRLKEAPQDAQLIALADKTANAESMIRDFRLYGRDRTYKMLGMDPERQAWYYMALSYVFEGTPLVTQPLFTRYQEAASDIASDGSLAAAGQAYEDTAPHPSWDTTPAQKGSTEA